jgi:hypothetical protein
MPSPPSGGSTPTSGCDPTRTNPAITVSPTAAAKGAVVRVTGTGFCANEWVKLFVGTQYFLQDTPADGNGNFTQDITIPTSASAPSGATFIKARGESSDKTATTPFTIE